MRRTNRDPLPEWRRVLAREDRRYHQRLASLSPEWRRVVSRRDPAEIRAWLERIERESIQQRRRDAAREANGQRGGSMPS